MRSSFYKLALVLLILTLPAWGPWNGGGSVQVPGNPQGVPTGATWTPPSYGACTGWTPTTACSTGSFFCPSTTLKGTGFWYYANGSGTTGASEPTWCATYGCTITDGSCTWTAGGTLNPIPGTWITALDLDFRTQSAQSFATNTTYTIGGLTWTKGNSANETVHAAIIGGGTGLNFQPVAATGNTGVVFTEPMLGTSLAALIPGFSFATPLRIWMYVQAGSIGNSSSNCAGCATTIGLSFGGSSLGFPTIYGIRDEGVFAQENTTPPVTCGASSFNFAAGANQSIIANGTNTQYNSFSNGVGVLEFLMPNGSMGMNWQTFVNNGASVWPRPADMITAGYQLSSGLSQNLETGLFTNALPAGQFFQPSQIYLYVGAMGNFNGGSQSGCTTTIGRIRVDYKLD